MGVILRVNKTKHTFYWFVSENSQFFNSVAVIEDNLRNKLSSKKMSILDYLIKAIFFFPIVLLIISVLLLIGGFVYLFFFLH